MSTTGYFAGAAPMAPAPHGPGPSYLPSQRHAHAGLTSNLLDVGILRSTILPSFGLHSGLSVAAYLAGRATNRLETKDWLWPSGMVLNAWWAAIGRHVADGVPVADAWNSLQRPEKLLLAAFSVWGGRLMWRIARRSVQRGKDEPRYEPAKKDPRFWGLKAFLGVYLPEALFQTAITLPFSLLFRTSAQDRGVSWLVAGAGAPAWMSAVAVGVFGAGFALETLADLQLDRFKARSVGTETEMCKDGVWSLVRHPNYLGDALVHFSFPLFLYGNNLLSHPLAVCGSIANYLFLRYFGGDKENEASQEERYTKENQTKKVDFQRYQQEVNSFWPGFEAVTNKWTWIVAGCGVAAAALEQAMR
ncbi:hypothetical protein MCOR25_010361 [Pyricularia grisea]|nr:hypothetical protein MCOR25_010361 [Pyricularia grisea]